MFSSINVSLEQMRKTWLSFSISVFPSPKLVNAGPFGIFPYFVLHFSPSRARAQTAICAFEIADTPSSRPRCVSVDRADRIFTDVFPFQTFGKETKPKAANRRLHMQFFANLKSFGG